MKPSPLIELMLNAFDICAFSLQGVFSQVFDLQASDFDNDDSYQRKGYVLSEVRIILAFCF